MRQMSAIAVKHNIEVAHRLSLLPGKCQQIHGHSMWVTLTIAGVPDENGIILEFGEVKRKFREHLDRNYDHHLLLNEDDPMLASWSPEADDIMYPGAKTFPGDPTTENIAKWVYEWARDIFGLNPQYRVEVWETSVNCAMYGDWI